MKHLGFAIASTMIASLLAAAPAAAQSDFDGMYAVATGNYALGIIDVGPEPDANFDGIGGGAFVGYGTSFDMFYLGVEGGIEYGDVSFSGTSNGASFTATRKETASVSARIGLAPFEESLLFVQGGLVFAKYEVSDGSTSEEWVDGYRIGVGAEQFVSDDVFARVGYDFDIDRNSTPFSPSALEGMTSTARIGLGMRF